MQKKTTNRPSLIACVIVLIFAANACNKQDGHSDVQTVDNFANSEESKFTLNNCTQQGTSDAAYVDLVDKWLKTPHEDRFVLVDDISFQSVKADLRDVLLATPRYISEAFFENWKAKIYLNEGPSEIISKIQEEGQKEIGIKDSFAAWTRQAKYNGLAFGSGSLSSGKTVSVQEAIHHGMLRAMAYYYFTRIIDNKDSVSSEGQKFRNMLLSKDASSIASKMVAGFKEDLKKIDGAKDFKVEDGDDLRRNLFIEVIDSDFCSESTRSKFKTQFPKLYAAYKDLKDK